MSLPPHDGDIRLDVCLCVGQAILIVSLPPHDSDIRLDVRLCVGHVVKSESEVFHLRLKLFDSQILGSEETLRFFVLLLDVA